MDQRLSMALGVLGLVIIGFLLGAYLATRHYLPKIIELQTKIDDASEQAKKTKKQQEENIHAIAKENDRRVDAINSYYQRLLRVVPTEASAGSAAACDQGNDGAASEQGLARLGLEFEKRCVQDANKVEMWQEYAEVNHIPVLE